MPVGDNLWLDLGEVGLRLDNKLNDDECDVVVDADEVVLLGEYDIDDGPTNKVGDNDWGCITKIWGIEKTEWWTGLISVNFNDDKLIAFNNEWSSLKMNSFPLEFRFKVIDFQNCSLVDDLRNLDT